MPIITIEVIIKALNTYTDSSKRCKPYVSPSTQLWIMTQDHQQNLCAINRFVSDFM